MTNAKAAVSIKMDLMKRLQNLLFVAGTETCITVITGGSMPMTAVIAASINADYDAANRR